MTGSAGNSEFLFPLNLKVSLGFASENIESLEETNSLFPLGPAIKYFLCHMFKIHHQTLFAKYFLKTHSGTLTLHIFHKGILFIFAARGIYPQ